MIVYTFCWCADWLRLVLLGNVILLIRIANTSVFFACLLLKIDLVVLIQCSFSKQLQIFDILEFFIYESKQFALNISIFYMVKLQIFFSWIWEQFFSKSQVSKCTYIAIDILCLHKTCVQFHSGGKFCMRYL